MNLLLVKRLLAALRVALPAIAAPLAIADVGPLPRADVFVLGELHDNPAHHATQADLVARISPTALVYEMISPDDAARIGDVADAAALAETLRWEAKGWPDFSMYHPIFLAAPEARIVGADVEREDLMAAMRSTATEVLGRDVVGADLWPRSGPVLDALIEDQRTAHCGELPEALLPGMVEAQRLRDAALALAARAAVEDTGGPVVVITGNGHARTDVGVPFVLDALAPGLSVWSLGQLEEEADEAPFDAVLVTEAVERGDPCEALR